MTDAPTLEQSFSGGRLVRPGGKSRDFVHLVRALARLAGAIDSPAAVETGHLERLIGPAEHYVFVLVDGMGDELVTLAPGKGFLQDHRVERLKTVYPSTTAAVLTSLATGTWPNQHASCGWWMYLAPRKVSITTLPFVERFHQRPLTEHGLGVKDVLPLSTIWKSSSHSLMTFLPRTLKDSAFARYMTGGEPRAGYETMDQAMELVGERVAAAGKPSFTYLYLPHFDARGHDSGIEKALPVLERIDERLGRLANQIEGKARLVVSADHGMIDLPDRNVRILDEHHELLRLLEVPPTGEPTMPIFHVRPGLEERFWELAHEVLGDLFALITPDDVERLALMGPGRLEDTARSRLGNFVGIASEPAALYLRQEGRDRFVHRAVHCGLSPSEMWIPLILAG